MENDKQPPTNPAQAPLGPQQTPQSVQPTQQPQPTVAQQPVSFQAPGQFTAPSTPNKNNKLKLIIIAIVVIVALGAVGLIASRLLSSGGSISSILPGGEAKLITYESQANGFKIDYFEGWEVEDKKEGFSKGATFIEPYDVNDKDSKFSASLYVSKDENDTEYSKRSKSDFFKFYGEDWKNREEKATSDPELQTISNVKVSEIEIGGHPALIVDADIGNYDRKQTGQTGRQQSAYVWISDSLQYRITLDTHSSDSKFADKATDIFNSFKVSE